MFRRVVKIDVEAVSAMLDELLADAGRSALEDMEPASRRICPCHGITDVRLGSHIRIEARDKVGQFGAADDTQFILDSW